MTTWTYWWMMQVGMAVGFATAMLVNWFLIKKGIKEPRRRQEVVESLQSKDSLQPRGAMSRGIKGLSNEL